VSKSRDYCLLAVRDREERTMDSDISPLFQGLFVSSCVQGLFGMQHLPQAQGNQRPLKHRESLSRRISSAGGGAGRHIEKNF